MNVISTDMDITSEMKKDAETKAKDFLGKTEIMKRKCHNK